jgi:hypothetical protein
LVEIQKQEGKQLRDVTERIVKQNTHKGLVTRQMWDRAQAKLLKTEL